MNAYDLKCSLVCTDAVITSLQTFYIWIKNNKVGVIKINYRADIITKIIVEIDSLH